MTAAAARLSRVLDAENAALRTLDLPAAAALLNEKLAATRSLAEAAAHAGTREAPNPEAAGLALRLRDLAQENRLLLERAIAVQGRVLDLVARAARQGTGQPLRYGAGGAATPEHAAMAMRLRA